MKAVIYARYSSENQREESIEGQLRDCREYAEYNGIEIVGTYIDRAFSAKTDNRPDFQRMIHDSFLRQFEAVLVWKLDRFARNRYDSAFYRYTLNKNGVKILSVKENIPDGSQGILLESLLEGMAEQYSANLSENVKRGFRENALKGKWNGGSIPLGYKVVDHKLAVDETTAPVVKLAFDLCADGKTVKEVQKFLNEKDVRNTKGTPIAYNSVRYMLSNRTYIGEYNHSGIVFEDGIPAIVDKATFDRVQEVIQKHSIAPAAHKEDDDYILTTHLFCGECGALMTAYSGTSRNGKVYRYYICNRKRKHLCTKEKVDKNWIEDFVVSRVWETLQDDATIDFLADYLVELQSQENTLIPLLQEQIKVKGKEIENIVNAIAKGIASDALMSKLTELEKEKSELDKTLAMEKIKAPILTKDQFKFSLLRFREIDITKKEGRQKLIDTFVNAIYLYDDRIKIIYNRENGEETVTLSELECSKSEQCGQP